jgi:hypothetical protein
VFTPDNLRGAGAFAATVFTGLGVEASTDGNHHRLVAYIVWYGLAGLLIVAVVGLTALVHARADVAPVPESVTEAHGGSGPGDFRGNVINESTINVHHPAAATQKPKRPFVNMTPLDLVALLHGPQTHLQGQRRIAPYMGKWLRVAGEVDDVRETGDTVTVNFAPSDDAPWVFLTFEGDMRPFVDHLNPGDHLAAIGQIAYIEARHIGLANCELDGSQE